ncbi:hypothetical protein [Helicobacter brantae]|uniref:Uncharacterized protein n=1 Tax=Helicobacter brantae TaxID=375927 RepID=A0A3D8IY57_9HELI|nr:hypothetical protein [Helicobacter brantae]RDU70198.1 hypothetical protein CQA58_06200 [Helicobacter brantae]
MDSHKLEQCVCLEEILSLADFERQVVKLISMQMQNLDIFESYKKGKISSREINLCGYYCNLETLIITPYSGVIGNVDLYLKEECVGGSLLFFESGILKFIEAYFWEENDFFLHFKDNEIMKSPHKNFIKSDNPLPSIRETK